MFFSKKLQKFKNLKHCFFSRKNGFSKDCYASLNCGMGSSDEKENVLKNLNLISQKIGCKNESLITLNQNHSNKVVYFEDENSIKNKLSGDAIVTKIKKIGINKGKIRSISGRIGPKITYKGSCGPRLFL